MPFNQKESLAAGRCHFQGHFIIEKIKSKTLVQWQNISRWPFWNVTQTILFWNYLSPKIFDTDQTAVQLARAHLEFSLIETLFDRPKLKLLKTFCLFIFFRQLPKCNILLCLKPKTHVQIVVLLSHRKSNFQISCTSLVCREILLGRIRCAASAQPMLPKPFIPTKSQNQSSSEG